MNNQYLEWLKKEVAKNGPMEVKTRGGDAARIIAIEPDCYTPIVGRVNDGGALSWLPSGAALSFKECSVDLILPTMPSQTREYWVNVYPGLSNLHFHENKSLADDVAGHARIGCRHISICQKTGKVTDITDEAP